MFLLTVATLASFALAESTAAGQGATDRAAIQKQIVQAETTIMKAILSNDPKTFHAHVTSGSFAVSGEGVMKAADFNGMMQQMKATCTFTKSGVADSTFHWINDSAVVHIYRATVAGTCGGQPVSEAWSSTVWTNTGGKWLAAHHHESDVVKSAGPSK